MAQIIMANCSTQLFLGSNAQKTLETFSKLLGEKTISHDSISRSTDKENSTSGHSYSDQIMARALMTPDELRRLDTDDCLIFLQAMKPIKAKKYWYYPKKARGVGGPHPRYDEAKSLEISHLTEGIQVRGNFVISNPTEWDGGKDEPSFEDIWNGTPSKSAPKTSAKSKVEEDPFADLDDIFLNDSKPTEKKDDNMFSDANLKKESASRPSIKDSTTNDDKNTVSFAGSGVTNVSNGFSDPTSDDFDYDLQAELEKKFDELFGKAK